MDDMQDDRGARQASEYAMALDLVGKVVRSDTEEEAVGNIFEVFTMLFAPKSLSYVALEEGDAVRLFISTAPGERQAEVIKRLQRVKGSYEKTSSQKGFIIKIGRNDRPFGTLEVEGLGFPQYLDHYLNLALSIVGVCGLAIENARRFQKIAEQKDRLSRALEELKKTQMQLVEAEKMASLGNLVAGVAHEINTPVGVGITASSALVEKNASLDSLYREKKMTRADLEDYLRFSGRTAKLLFDNLHRAGELVKSFKQVSADQTAEWKRKLFLHSYLNDVVEAVRPKWAGKRIRIDIDCDENLEIDSYPGWLAQVVTNLLVNSTVHGFEGCDDGTITISADKEGGRLLLRYTDDGKGIAGEVLPRVFEPFFTTNKQKGSGLGLHIVYNIVVNRLKGGIDCQSEPGKGVLFEMNIPL